MSLDWSALLVHDGDLVHAEGRFVRSASGDSYLCGQVARSLTGSAHDCPPHLLVKTRGLDADRLGDETSTGLRSGYAAVTGIWANRELHVDTQSPLEGLPEPQQALVPHSAAWLPGPMPSLSRLRAYLDEHPEDFGPLWVGHRSDLAAEPTSPEEQVDVVVVPVVGADPESKRPALSRLFGGNLFLPRAKASLAEIDKAHTALRPLMAEPTNGISMIGAGAPSGLLRLHFLVTTAELYARLSSIGLDLIEPHPSIRPAP